jgi:GntR family transcriptional regulator
MQEDGMMDINIDPNSHVPIYLQIVSGIRSAVASGVLRPGEPLPSLRSLGVELKVNPNTVQRAFDELEREGLVYPRRGVGMYVSESGLRPAQGRDERVVVEAFQKGIEAGRAAKVPPGRLRQLFNLAMQLAARGAGERR